MAPLFQRTGGDRLRQSGRARACRKGKARRLRLFIAAWSNRRPMPMSAQTPAKTLKKSEMTVRLRELPSVDELLGRPRLVALAESAGRGVVTQVARSVLADLRARLLKGAGAALDPAATSSEVIEAQVAAGVESLLAPSLRRVINATGVILHTNLGRAPLAAAAAAAI